ncbi:tRNA pseudouridine(38-40) synthase TruA [Ruminococcaceae bacterium OttesenSCG-928-I18]|nr:tRNA pseudouridine(38-40) synthase TruA [Ruminococcaceae bacterium OttesenSCG-928-I18]
MNVLLTLAFKGTNYHGFQVQDNALSVCEVVQDALQAVLGKRPEVKGSSRTDAGVHARGFALSFRMQGAPPPEKLPLALNAHLPPDIRVREARSVPEDFHARYDAIGKEYTYTLLNSMVDDPLLLGLYYRINGALDEEAMQSAADALAGTHDFSAFCAAGAKPGDRTRTLNSLKAERRGDWVRIRAQADGFLYHMMRILAGTLVLAGQGKLDAGQVAAILASRQRGKAGPTLPAKGLCLERVFYPDSVFL